MAIRLGVTGLRKTRVVYLLDLPEGRGEKGQCDLVFRALLDDCTDAGLCMLMSYSRVVSVSLSLWGIDLILRNGCRI